MYDRGENLPHIPLAEAINVNIRAYFFQAFKKESVFNIVYTLNFFNMRKNF